MRLRVLREVCASVGFLTLAAAVAGCSSFGGSTDCEAPFEQDLSQTRAAIEEEIGDAEASSEAACKVLPLGAKPCGGPWEYLVSSAEDSDPQRLKTLADEYHRLDAARNEACELASDCMMEAPPAVALEDGHCVRAQP